MEKSIPYLDGWRAHMAGAEVEENPFSERLQSISNAEWQSGWCARFSAVKHGGDMMLDYVTTASQ